MEILIPKDKETYQEYINRVLDTRENKKSKTDYQEKHHIIPKSLGGSNNRENLVWLYAQEHYYAHKLLAKENPSNQGLQLAWWNMCQCNKKGKRAYNVSADEYAEAREKAAKANSEIRKGMKFSEEHIKHLCGHGKPVVNITTGEKFSSVKEASKKTGINASHISECCKGKRPSAGKNSNQSFVWRYVGEENFDFGMNKFTLQKSVQCVETGKIYDSIREASRDTGIGRTTIKHDCLKLTKRTKSDRVHFQYYNNSKK